MELQFGTIHLLHEQIAVGERDPIPFDTFPALGDLLKRQLRTTKLVERKVGRISFRRYSIGMVSRSRAFVGPGTGPAKKRGFKDSLSMTSAGPPFGIWNGQAFPARSR